MEDFTDYGRLLEGIHTSGYTLERSINKLKYLLENDRWKLAGKFETIDDFMSSLKMDNVKWIATERKEIAKQLDSIGASQRKIAGALGVSHTTVQNDLDSGNKLPKQGKTPIENEEVTNDSGNKLTPAEPSGTEVAKMVEKKQESDARKQEREANYELLKSDNSGIISDTNISLLEGDFFEMVKTIPDKSIDLINTDPPYNMDKEGWDSFSIDEFREFTYNWLNEVKRVLKDEYTMFVSINADNLMLFDRIFNDLNYKIQSRLIWHYRNAGGKSAGKFKFSKTYEIIYHLGNKELNFDPVWSDERFDVWTIAIPQSNFNDGKFHPTQKPLELYKKLIRLGANQNDSVLDCFAGSGTTGIICSELNMNCILIEREKKYINIIKNRI